MEVEGSSGLAGRREGDLRSAYWMLRVVGAGLKPAASVASWSLLSVSGMRNTNVPSRSMDSVEPPTLKEPWKR